MNVTYCWVERSGIQFDCVECEGSGFFFLCNNHFQRQHIHYCCVPPQLLWHVARCITDANSF